MVKKPENWEEVAVMGGWSPLEVGGHYLDVLAVEEKQSKSGRDMLVVWFDTAKTDSQPMYFTNNHEKGKYYHGQHYIVLGEEEWAVRNLKSFTSAVENSNPGYTWNWDINTLKGKKVGGIFGEEEYLNDKGELKVSTKLRWWCSYDRVANATIPKKKELPTSQATTAQPDTSASLPFDL